MWRPFEFLKLFAVISALGLKLRMSIGEMGAGNALLYAADRLLGRASLGSVRLRRYRIVAQPIGKLSWPALPKDGPTLVGSTPAESPLVASFPRPPDVIRQRYESGAECYAAVVRSVFAGFIWFRRGWYDEDEVRCRYVLAASDRCVWDFDVYVEPRFRLGRTLARLWQTVDSHLAEGGIQWSFSRISVFNAESISAHARLGTVDCGSATFVSAGPIQLALIPGAPYVHLSFTDRQRPSIRLTPPS